MSPDKSDKIAQATDAATGPVSAQVDERADTAGLLPRNCRQRCVLNDEIHARPPERLTAPTWVSYLALLADPTQRQEAWQALGALANR